MGARRRRRQPGQALARGLHDTVPLIAGAGLTSAVAYRWKCQINENAKLPAFAHELPGARPQRDRRLGRRGRRSARFSAVFLDDSDLHPRVRQRIELTRELIEPAAPLAYVVETQGESALERVLSLVLLGDLVSIYLAVLRGVDPTPVEVIERLKDELARE